MTWWLPTVNIEGLNDYLFSEKESSSGNYGFSINKEPGFSGPCKFCLFYFFQGQFIAAPVGCGAAVVHGAVHRHYSFARFGRIVYVVDHVVHKKLAAG